MMNSTISWGSSGEGDSVGNSCRSLVEDFLALARPRDRTRFASSLTAVTRSLRGAANGGYWQKHVPDSEDVGVFVGSIKVVVSPGRPTRLFGAVCPQPVGQFVTNSHHAFSGCPQPLGPRPSPLAVDPLEGVTVGMSGTGAIGEVERRREFDRVHLRLDICVIMRKPELLRLYPPTFILLGNFRRIPRRHYLTTLNPHHEGFPSSCSRRDEYPHEIQGNTISLQNGK